MAARPRSVTPDEPMRSSPSEKLGRGAKSALLLAGLPDELGIVTDADLRARVVTGEVALDAPASAVARTPVLTAPPGQLAIEATVDMRAAGVEHIAVVAEHGRDRRHVGGRPDGT